MPAPDEICDVAVVGGGLIGAAAALGVARQGRRVVLVEPHEPHVNRGRLGVDIRNVAVSPASQALLDEIGVWNALPAAPYRRMEVWEELGTRAMEFDAAEAGRDELGWIAESSPAVVALWAALEDADMATVRVEPLVDMAELTADAGAVKLVLESGTVRARLVLAADGAQSHVRQRLGVAVRTFDVGHVALATVVRTEDAHGDTAYQRFLLDGPLALLPSLDPHQCSVVWSQSPDAARRHREQNDEAFARSLERALQRRLGSVEAVDRRVAFPLSQQLADSFNPHPRVVLLGDAARVLHPMAGLGGNLGFEDAREVLAVLGALGPGADAGAAGLWRAYDRQRRARARLMLGVMDALRRVYARGDPLSQWVRNLGVDWVNRTVTVKRQIMMEAMGLGPVARGTGMNATASSSPPAGRG